MGYLVDLVVKVLGLVFSTALERHDKKEEANAVQTNTQAFQRNIAEGNADAISVALDVQHDRVQQALCGSGLEGASASEQGTASGIIQGQGTTAESPVDVPKQEVIPAKAELPTVVTPALFKRLKQEEGYSSKPYWDREQWTYGYGCKAPNGEARIAEPAAAELLSTRLKQSVEEFFVVFKGHTHKFNEVRQECFIDMLFNLGKGGVLKFTQTLKLIQANDVVPWSSVAEHLKDSLWYRQVGARAKRICTEVGSGKYLA